MSSRVVPAGYLSLTQTMNKLGLSRTVLRSWVRQGFISSLVISRSRYFPQSDVERLRALQATHPLDINQTARRLGVYRQTLSSWANQGLIEHVVIAGKLRFSPSTVQRFAQSLKPFNLTGRAAASRLNVSSRTLKRWVAEGLIDTLQLGTITYYKSDQINRIALVTNSYTTSQVAQKLGVSTNTVGRLGDRGLLRFSLNSHGHRRYALSDIEHLDRTWKLGQKGRHP